MLASGFVTDGMDEMSGATAFLPGSHRVSDADCASGVDPAAVAGTDPRRACCGPGALVAIHPKVIHGGAGNASDRWRRNIVVQIGAADEPLVTEARESVTGRTLPIG